MYHGRGETITGTMRLSNIGQPAVRCIHVLLGQVPH